MYLGKLKLNGFETLSFNRPFAVQLNFVLWKNITNPIKARGLPGLI